MPATGITPPSLVSMASSGAENIGTILFLGHSLSRHQPGGTNLRFVPYPHTNIPALNSGSRHYYLGLASSQCMGWMNTNPLPVYCVLLVFKCTMSTALVQCHLFLQAASLIFNLSIGFDECTSKTCGSVSCYFSASLGVCMLFLFLLSWGNWYS